MRNSAGLLCAALIPAIVGCGGSVDDESGGRRSGVNACVECGSADPGRPGSQGDDHSNDSTPASPPTQVPPPTPTPAPAAPGAIAMRYGDLPPPSGGSGGASGGGPVIDPNTLYVAIGSTAPLCADPFAWQGCGTWKVGIGIPAELLRPGVIELDDPRLISHFSSAGEDRGGGDCSAGAGSFIQGTVEIVRIDAEAIEVRLANTSMFDFDVNGSYRADFCR